MAHLLKDRQAARGRWRLWERSVRPTAEHVPDRFGESAGEVDLGDFGAALLADACFGLLVAVAVGRGGTGVRRGFEERPAQVARALCAERAAQVAFAGLVDAGQRPL